MRARSKSAPMIRMRTMPLRFLALLLPVLLHAGCGDEVQSATVDLGAPEPDVPR